MHEIFQHKIFPYKCNKKGCGKSFTKEQFLDEHVKLVHEKKGINKKETEKKEIGKPWKCKNTEKCIKKDIAFETEAQLKRHLKAHEEKIYKCDQCPKSFARKDHLTSHLNTHRGEKLFGCRECSESFTSAGSRHYHEKNNH